MTSYRTDFLVGAWAIVEKWYESGDRLDLSSIWPEVQHQQRDSDRARPGFLSFDITQQLS